MKGVLVQVLKMTLFSHFHLTLTWSILHFHLSNSTWFVSLIAIYRHPRSLDANEFEKWLHRSFLERLVEKASLILLHQRRNMVLRLCWRKQSDRTCTSQCWASSNTQHCRYAAFPFLVVSTQENTYHYDRQGSRHAASRQPPPIQETIQSRLWFRKHRSELQFWMM